METILRKYPSTKHFPWTQHSTTDDKIMSAAEVVRNFSGREVAVTEKLDGENTSMYSDHIHARSTSGRPHPSREIVKQMHASIKGLIPDNWRICGENVRQQHSIHYSGLGTYFFVFAIFDENNVCLSYDDTKDFANELGLTMVRELYRGPWDEKAVKACYTGKSAFDAYDVAEYRQSGVKVETSEGYVCRVVDSFPSPEPKKGEKTWFETLAKFVREDHVTTSEHWMFENPVWNEL
ncbi:MAG: RNA ligase family protein [Candidatus Competibacteraceae bacterium]|nr:RNA ligase family protein [Candidatus Competibacteraceae bacterium]